MSLRYLEYVERYPARPGGTALRRLAAALQTTPAALLGARAQVPPARTTSQDTTHQKLPPARAPTRSRAGPFGPEVGRLAE